MCLRAAVRYPSRLVRGLDGAMASGATALPSQSVEQSMHGAPGSAATVAAHVFACCVGASGATCAPDVDSGMPTQAASGPPDSIRRAACSQALCWRRSFKTWLLEACEPVTATERARRCSLASASGLRRSVNSRAGGGEKPTSAEELITNVSVDCTHWDHVRARPSAWHPLLVPRATGTHVQSTGRSHAVTGFPRHARSEKTN